MNFKVYVINLDQKKERWTSIKNSLDGAGIEVERVLGVNGHNIERENWQDIDIKEFQYINGRDVLPGEYGCYQSHLKALKLFLESGDEIAVISEDDVLYNKHSKDRINAFIDKHLNNLDNPLFDVVKLMNHRSKLFIAADQTEAGDLIGRTVFGPQGSASAYLVTRRGAERLLATLKIMKLPWDFALEEFWDNKTEVFSSKDNILEFSTHRSDSAISIAGGYANAKYTPLKRLGALMFRIKSHCARSHNVLLGSKKLYQHSSMALDASPSINSKWFDYAIFLVVMAFVSALWFESDAYRYAGIILVVLGFIYYFRFDLNRYDKPIIGWAGIACIFWALYVITRLVFNQLSVPEYGYGSAEGIYLFQLLYPSLAYSVFVFIKRPILYVLGFLSLSLAFFLVSTDVNALLTGLVPTSYFHNNTIHAATASGFVFLVALSFGGYIFQENNNSKRFRMIALLLTGLVLILSLINIIVFSSKGIWLALVITLPILLAWIAILSKTHVRWAVPVFALIALASVIIISGDRIMLKAGATAQQSIVLLNDMVETKEVTASMDRIITSDNVPYSMKARLKIYSDALKIWKQKPLFGHGSTWRHLWNDRQYQDHEYSLLHNSYLEILVRYGIFGILFFIGLYSWCFMQVRNASQTGLISIWAYHAYLSILIYLTIALLTNSTIRLAIGESTMWMLASFGFYCYFLTQRYHQNNIRTYF